MWCWSLVLISQVARTRHFWRCVGVGHRNGYDSPNSGVRRVCVCVSLSLFIYLFFFASLTRRQRSANTALRCISSYHSLHRLFLLHCISSSSSLSLCSTSQLLSLSVFFLCLLIFFVFSLFNFLVCVPHLTWSVLNTE